MSDNSKLKARNSKLESHSRPPAAPRQHRTLAPAATVAALAAGNGVGRGGDGDVRVRGGVLGVPATFLKGRAVLRNTKGPGESAVSE